MRDLFLSDVFTDILQKSLSMKKKEIRETLQLINSCSMEN